MRRLLLLSASLIAALAAAPAAEAAKTCRPKPRHHTVETIVANSLVRVYKVVDPDHAEGFEDTGVVYACHRGTGWRKRLGFDGAYPDLHEVRAVLKGSHVAYSVGCSGCREHYRFAGRVGILDLPAREHDFVWFHSEEEKGFATDLVLKSNGGIAWISYDLLPDGGYGHVVRRNDNDGFAELDSGRDIEPESLTLGPQSTLRWVSGGRRRTAPIN